LGRKGDVDEYETGRTSVEMEENPLRAMTAKTSTFQENRSYSAVIASGVSEEGAFRCTLSNGSSGYGLKFGGPRSPAEGEKRGFGIYVSTVMPHGDASAKEEVQVGLQVLSLNGHDLRQGTTRELTTALQTATESMELDLAENKELFNAYTALRNAGPADNLPPARPSFPVETTALTHCEITALSSTIPTTGGSVKGTSDSGIGTDDLAEATAASGDC
jgi:hypothetical protein